MSAKGQATRREQVGESSAGHMMAAQARLPLGLVPGEKERLQAAQNYVETGKEKKQAG